MLVKKAAKVRQESPFLFNVESKCGYGEEEEEEEEEAILKIAIYIYIYVYVCVMLRFFI
jgi:hypothetical protein